MVKWFVGVFLALALVAGAGLAFGAAFPELGGATDVQGISCPDGELRFRAQFPVADGILVYFGRVDTREADPKAVTPYVWLKYDVEGKLVEATLIDVDNKPQVLTLEALQAKFPSPCTLTGTGV